MLSRQSRPSHRSLAVAMVVVLGCLMLPMRISAQTTPKLELAGGVGALYSTELFKHVVPAEWLAAAAWNAGDVLAIVGEVGRLPPARHGISTHDIYTTTYPCEALPARFVPPGFACPASGTVDITRSGTGERNVDIYSFLIGPRFTRRAARLSPFVHVLFGVGRVSWDAALAELPPGTVRTGRGEQGDVDASDLPLASQTTSMAVQIGAGLNVHMGERLTARFTADRRQLLGEPLYSSQFRVSTQLVVGLGAQ